MILENEILQEKQKVKDVIAKAFLNELDTVQLKGLLENALSSFSEQKIGALLNTSIRTTERMAYAELVNDLPDDTIFEYVGPQDDKNRPFCAQWVGQTIQKSELETLLNDDGEPAMTAAGGYSCRHSWEIV